MGGEGLKKRKKVEKPGGQLDCQDTAFHAWACFHLPLLPEEREDGEDGS